MGRTKNAFRIIGICGGAFIIGADSLAIGVVIGPMAASLDASLATTQWFLSGYGIGVATFFITAGKISDSWGIRKANLLGLLLFGIGSALIAVAPTSLFAISARLLQGIAGAFMMSSSLAFASSRYEGQARARVFSYIMASSGLGMGVGPLIAGAVVDLFDWRAVFWINLPYCALWILLTALTLEKDPPTRRVRLDLTGLLLLSATILCLTIALSQGPDWGWGDPITLLLIVGFLLGLPLFLIREIKTDHALLQLRIFRIKSYFPASMIGFFSYFVALGWLFLTSLYLHRVEELSPLSIGISLTPYAFSFLIGGILSAPLGARIGWTNVLSGGLVILGTALIILAIWQTDFSRILLTIPFFALGLGFVGANNGSLTIAHAHLPSDLVGVSTGTSLMFRWLGTALGIAIVTIVLHEVASRDLEKRYPSNHSNFPTLQQMDEFLVSHGSWENETKDLPDPARKEAVAILSRSFSTGVSAGLFLLGGVSLLGALTGITLRSRPSEKPEEDQEGQVVQPLNSS
ncbi:MAG: MFS transporter [Verrucomicrobiota bacterium]